MSQPAPAWTPRQLAEVIRMSKNFVLSEIHAKAIHAVKFGNRYRIPDREVKRYLRAHRFSDALVSSHEPDAKRA